MSCVIYILLTFIYGSDTSLCSMHDDHGHGVGATQCDNFMPRWFTAYFFVPALLSLGMVIVLPGLPESPRWLLAHRTPDECLASMRELRKVHDVKREFSDIYQALSSDARQEDSWMDLLTNQNLRYRVFLTFLLPLCHELAGAELSKVQLYSLTNAVHLALPLEMLGTLTGQVLGAYLCFRYIDVLGRQVLMVGSCLGGAATWLFAAWCVHGMAPTSMLLLWVVALFTAQAAFFHSGMANIMCFLQAEIFPLRARSRGVVLATLLKGYLTSTLTLPPTPTLTLVPTQTQP